MRRGNVSGQAPESRAASCRKNDYSGTLTRCTGLTIVYGHIVVDATMAATIAVIDDSIDWRDRIITMHAFTPATVAAGIPPTAPYLCAPISPVNNYYYLDGSVWLSGAGWDTTSPLGAMTFCNMIHAIDRNVIGDVRFYADNVQGQLKVKVAAGNNRGITYMFFASEQLGYAVAVP